MNKITLKKMLFVLLGIGTNYIGKQVAIQLSLPFWLDAIGTGLVACVAGMVYGAFCGGLTNLVFGMVNPVSCAYSIVSIMVGLIIGYSYKKGAFNRLFNAMSV